MKSGMTLIELAIAIAIGALLLLGLYRTFTTTQKTVQTVDGVLAHEHQKIMLYNLLYHDITGMFEPKKPEEKSQQKQKPSCVYKQDERMQEFSFATTHALQQYNRCIPHCVQTTYHLQKQENSEPTQFSLIRKETPIGSDNPEQQKTKSYSVASGLTKIKVELFYPEPENKKDNPGKNSKTNYLKASSWPLPKPQDKKDAKQPPLPAYVHINGSLYNTISLREEPFVYKVPVPGFVQPEKKKQPTKQVPKEPPAQRKK